MVDAKSSNLESLIARVNACIPASVTPATRIAIHPSDWLTLVDALERRAPETPAEGHLGRLLAIIHGDGGQYQSKHGDAKATEDAIAKYYATRFDALCPHGMPLAENICGPCSKGRPNRRAVKTSPRYGIPEVLAFLREVPSGCARRISTSLRTNATTSDSASRIPAADSRLDWPSRLPTRSVESLHGRLTCARRWAYLTQGEISHVQQEELPLLRRRLA